MYVRGYREWRACGERRAIERSDGGMVDIKEQSFKNIPQNLAATFFCFAFGTRNCVDSFASTFIRRRFI